MGRQRGDKNRRKSQVRVDESEDTTTSVMSTGGNRVLSTESPVRAEGITIFGTFWLTKDEFPGAK